MVKRSRPWCGRALLAFLVGLPAFGAFPQTPADTAKAALAGVVRDTKGRPISEARIIAIAADKPSVTDDSGRFHVGGLPPGPNEITIVRLGYSPVSFETPLPANRTMIVEIRLRAIQTLEGVEVRAQRSVRLARTGYFDRERLGIGTFISPERIDSLSHLPSPGWLLRDARGLTVHCGTGGCTIAPRRPPLCMYLFVDGVYSRRQLDDAVSMAQVYAIEVYERPNMVPTEFQAPLPPKSAPLTTNAGCSALVVWTRGRGGP